MRFSYARLRMRQPVVSLGGRRERPRPLVPITALGRAGVYLEQAILDTGADDTIFHESVAAKLGIDLTASPQGLAAGVGGAPVVVRYAEVTLRLADNLERREWRAWVGFTPVNLRRPLLGFAGCLQFFDAQFFGQREEVELIINSLYPGT
jgi:hypothetical protein